MTLIRNTFIFLLYFSASASFGQSELPLNDLRDFEPQAGNWMVVGDASMKLAATADDSKSNGVQHTGSTEGKSKRKKKRQKKLKDQQPADKHAHASVDFTPGTGILLNINDDVKKDHLVTNWEHGDIELEFDVMVPKGSNSGVYLQGRYEIQIFDSWGVKNPRYGDMGGIYRNWETDPAKKLYGIPPTTNASKAPGLWQHMKIRFQAPKFDASGDKISNAFFEYVELNGVRIHTNVSVARATGGPISKEEVPTGPLMIQGDHGAVAFKNIKYTLLDDSKVQINNLEYQRYQGKFDGPGDLQTSPVVDSGSTSNIDIAVVPEEDAYGIAFQGDLAIPVDDEYFFTVHYSGGYKLLVNNQLVSEVNANAFRGSVKKSIPLKKGTYPIELINVKSAPWHAPTLGLNVNTNSTFPKKFHTANSYSETVKLTPPILVNPEATPRMLRGFVYYQGGQPVLTHTIGVGHPDQLNYIFDLDRGHLVAAWKGDFIDATPMWNGRGNGSFKPAGSTWWNFLNQPLAKLNDLSQPFPEKQSELLAKGYQIDEADGLPTFNYTYSGIEVTSTVKPSSEKTHFTHQLTFSNSGENLYYKLAEGPVKELGPGYYAIDNQQYYLRVIEGGTPIERQANSKNELIIPVNSNTLHYEIIW